MADVRSLLPRSESTCLLSHHVAGNGSWAEEARNAIMKKLILSFLLLVGCSSGAGGFTLEEALLAAKFGNGNGVMFDVLGPERLKGTYVIKFKGELAPSGK